MLNLLLRSTSRKEHRKGLLVTVPYTHLAHLIKGMCVLSLLGWDNGNLNLYFPFTFLFLVLRLKPFKRYATLVQILVSFMKP